MEGKELLPCWEYSPEMIAQRLAGAEPATSSQLDIPPRPPLLCPGCPHRGVFYTLRRMRVTVMGDIGCYTLGALSPLEAMDACVCMGASIGMAMGMEKPGENLLPRWWRLLVIPPLYIPASRL